MQRRTTFTAIAALTALFLLPGLAAAQRGPQGSRGPDGPGHRGEPDPARMLERMEHRLDEMKGPLNLTQRQETRIRNALRRGATEARRVLEQHPDRSPERREALRRVRWQTDDRVHAVLNCEQRERFRQLRREHRHERRGDRHQRRQRRGHRGGQGSGAGPTPDGGL